MKVHAKGGGEKGTKQAPSSTFSLPDQGLGGNLDFISRREGISECIIDTYNIYIHTIYIHIHIYSMRKEERKT